MQEKLTDNKSKNSDISGVNLTDEFNNLIPFVNDITSPIKILQFILEDKLVETFPNVTTALQILLTLPSTVTSGERSLSKLK